jgi:hypothetical protein
MSERGSFITDFIYCEKCFERVSEILRGDGKFLKTVQVPHWNEGYLPILAGKIGSSYPGGELEEFANDLIPKIKSVVCHPVRIAVLAENGECIFKVEPEQ